MHLCDLSHTIAHVNKLIRFSINARLNFTYFFEIMNFNILE